MTNTVLNVNTRETESKTGVEKEKREQLAKELNIILASSYSLYAQTHGVHWNVAGPLFYSIHKLTEEQYEDLAGSIDDTAERIRALGFNAPAGLDAMVNHSILKEDNGFTNAGDMINHLIKDSETLATKMRDVVIVAESCDDVKTADLLTERIGQLEKNVWMLRATAA